MIDIKIMFDFSLFWQRILIHFCMNYDILKYVIIQMIPMLSDYSEIPLILLLRFLISIYS